MTSRDAAGLRVHLARTGDPGLDRSIDGFEQLAARSSAGHVLVDDPAEADLLLLTQAHLCPDPLSLKALRESVAWTRHREKTFVVDFRDRPWCAFPGLYTSMPGGHFRSTWQRAWLYPWIDETAYLPMREGDPDVLFSFVGGRTHPCRDAILALSSERAVIDDSTGFDYLDPSPEAEQRREVFRTALTRSKFVLCPRGHGTSSFRLQEVLAAGRVPVIISDDWVQPAGPAWAEATVRWPEAQVEALPDHLPGLEERYEAMAAAAAALYDQWFAFGVMFDRMIDQLTDIPRSDPFPARGVRGLGYGRLLLAATKGRVVEALHGTDEPRMKE